MVICCVIVYVCLCGVCVCLFVYRLLFDCVFIWCLLCVCVMVALKHWGVVLFVCDLFVGVALLCYCCVVLF